MGIGCNFWDLLKPCARNEGFDFLRNKKVAVDLSYWIVQQETAIKTNVRNPHLRITFFRTINLFSELGAYPVFVVDGVPSPLKTRARIARFYSMSGIDCSNVLKEGDLRSPTRNRFFTKCVQECVELLEFLGMPILRARGEAEALCAQLNLHGFADACITADSDVFLFGAKCVIKCLNPNSKEPIECYFLSDIESHLGLKRKQMVALSLLVGNDYDPHGVPGIGISNAVRLVKLFSEDEILHRLHDIGKGKNSFLQGGIYYPIEYELVRDKNSFEMKVSHCSYCGHPGSIRIHRKHACEYCKDIDCQTCKEKSYGFKCECHDCGNDRKIREQQRQEDWKARVFKQIAAKSTFPNDDIIKIYLNHDDQVTEIHGFSLSWEYPNIEFLVDFLSYHLRWKPSFIRQKLVPMLSTIFLREMASNPSRDALLYNQYEFHSIQRLKIRHGHPFYLVNWRRTTINLGKCKTQDEQSDIEENKPINLLDELVDSPKIFTNDGCCFMTTTENKELVTAAFPQKVELFLQEKNLKESKSSRSGLSSRDKSRIPQSSCGRQMNIMDFYRTMKIPSSESLMKSSVDQKVDKRKNRRPSSNNFSKSARRRLLFG